MTPPKAASPLDLGAVLYFREGSRRRDCDVTEADYDDATERLLLAGRLHRYVLDGAEDLPEFLTVTTKDIEDI